MENATEALKMAGAMLLFVMALSVTIYIFSSAREASSSVMEYSERSRTFYDIDETDLLSEREVQVDTVIAKLYSAYSSQETIAFYTGKKSGNNITGIKEHKLYYTEALDRKTKSDTSTVLQDSTLVLDPNSPTDNRAIYGIDLSDEQLREEPWQSNEKTKKNFIDALINKEKTPLYSWSRNVQNSSNEYISTPVSGIKIGFVYNFDGSGTPLINLPGKFIERIGLYNSDAIAVETPSTSSTTTGYHDVTYQGSNTTSSTIAFNGVDETIENEEGTKRKIIQYIYIR